MANKPSYNKYRYWARKWLNGVPTRFDYDFFIMNYEIQKKTK